MTYRYVPLLRAKAGEANALFNLTPAAKDRMFPVVHLPVTVPTTFSTKLGQAWAGRRLALDGLFNFDANGSAIDMQTVFAALMAAGVTVVPCVEYGAQVGYLNVAGGLANGAGSGLVVKTRLGHLGAVQGWLANAGFPPAQVDLVVVAGHIADFGDGVLDQLVVHTLQNFPQPEIWRSITLAGSAAPKDASALGLGANMIPRLDWTLWQNTHAVVPFKLDYGDHAISHPDMTEPPGYVMGNATVTVRYALDNHWLILKGRPVSGNTGVPMPAQYLGHAQTLVARPDFNGLVGCWGDDRIVQIAAGAVSPGSRQTWVEIGVNRHLSLVADRLP